MNIDLNPLTIELFNFMRPKDININSTPKIYNFNTSVYAQYTIQTDNRTQLQAGLKERGIPTAVHYPRPLSRQPSVVDLDCHVPVSDTLAASVLSLPMSAYMTDEVRTKIVEAIT